MKSCSLSVEFLMANVGVNDHPLLIDHLRLLVSYNK